MDNIRFRCQKGCTRCCEVSGFVYLSQADVKKAAGFLKMSVRAFEKTYVYRTRHLARLRKPPDRQCPFLLDGGCSIHPAKPTQCRLFPFWPELLEVKKQWQATAKWCPGIGQGPLIQIGTAHETAAEMKHAYPSMYAD